MQRLATNSVCTLRLGCTFTEILSFNRIEVIFKICCKLGIINTLDFCSANCIPRHCTSAWRCSFVLANRLADSQAGKTAGRQCILWRSCTRLLLEPIACLESDVAQSRGSAALDFCSANRTSLGCRAQVKIPNFLYSSETITLSI